MPGVGASIRADRGCHRQRDLGSEDGHGREVYTRCQPPEIVVTGLKISPDPPNYCSAGLDKLRRDCHSGQQKPSTPRPATRIPTPGLGAVLGFCRATHPGLVPGLEPAQSAVAGPHPDESWKRASSSSSSAGAPCIGQTPVMYMPRGRRSSARRRAAREDAPRARGW